MHVAKVAVVIVHCIQVKKRLTSSSDLCGDNWQGILDKSTSGPVH